MSNKISQREARRLQKRVRELLEREAGRARIWNKDYPGGVHICTEPRTTEQGQACLLTSAKLGYYVIAKLDGDQILFYAVKP